VGGTVEEGWKMEVINWKRERGTDEPLNQGKKCVFCEYCPYNNGNLSDRPHNHLVALPTQNRPTPHNLLPLSQGLY